MKIYKKLKVEMKGIQQYLFQYKKNNLTNAFNKLSRLLYDFATKASMHKDYFVEGRQKS